MLNFYGEEREDDYLSNINENLEDNNLVRTVERSEDDRYIRMNHINNNQNSYYSNICTRENISRKRRKNNCNNKNIIIAENQCISDQVLPVDAYGTFVAYGGNIIEILEKFPIKKYAGVTPVGIHLDKINSIVVIEKTGIYDVFISAFIEVGIGAKIELNVNGVGMMHLPPIVAIGQVVGNDIIKLNRGDKLTLNAIGIGIKLCKGIGASIRLIKIG